MASTRRWFSVGFVAAMVAALMVPVLAGAAPAATPQGDRVGVQDPATAIWSLEGLQPFVYGNPGDQPFMGDWNCDGVDTPGLYRAEDTAAGPAGKVYLRNSNTTGIADVEYFFGDPNDVAVAGDFNGNGCDSVGLFRPSTGQVFLTNRLGSANRGIGAAETSYTFDAQGYDLSSARALAGDFNGDGADTVALHLRSLGVVLGTGAPFSFGDPGDQLVAGAWNGSSIDTVAVYRSAVGSFYLSDTNKAGVAPASRSVAAASGVALAWSNSPQPRNAHSPSATATDYVVIASNSAKVNTGAVLGGNVAVNTAAAGATLSPGFELALERAATVDGDIAADDIVLGRVSIVGDGLGGIHDAFYRTSAVVNADVVVNGPFQVPSLLPVVAPPPFQSAAPGVVDKVVPVNGTLTLAPGAYRDVTVGQGGTLNLSGQYDIRSLNSGKDSRVLASGPTTVRVQGRLFVGNDSTVGTTAAAMVSPWDFAFHVGGTNLDPLNPLSSPAAAWLGSGGTLGAVIHAPNGTVRIDQNKTGSTQLVGRDVRVEKNSVLSRPPAARDVAASVSEDGPAVTAPFDVDTFNGELLTSYFIVDDPAKGTATANGDGTFTFDPARQFEYLNDGQSEDVTFTYRAKTATGVASNTATVTVTVLGENDGVTANDDFYDADEDTVLVVALPGVLGNDDDPDGDATAVPIVNGQSKFGAGVNLNADGSFTYDPAGLFESLAVDESEEDTFEYTAQNDLPSSSTATVTITVLGANDPPTANDGEASGTGTFLITVSGTDPDTSDNLEVTAASATLGTVGTITNFDGSGAEDKNTATIEYTAPALDPPDVLTFTMVDGNGGSATGEVLINQGPEPPEDPPGVEGVAATDKTVETEVDKAVRIVLSAATDAAGDLLLSIESGPTGGTLGAVTQIDPDGAGPLPVRSAEVTYTPPAGLTGTFSFDFRAEEDGNDLNFGIGTVTIIVEEPAVLPAPQNPGVVDLNFTFEENASFFFSLAAAVNSTGTSFCEDPEVPCGRAAPSDLSSAVTDPAGDATNSTSDDPANPDLVSAVVGVTEAIDSVGFDVRYVAGGFDATTTRTTIVIDIDENPSTGFPGVDAANNDASLIGVEYLVQIGADLGANAEIQQWVSGNTFTSVAVVPATIHPDGHHALFSLDLLGDDDGEFRYKVATQSQISPTPGFTGILDYMPDLGTQPGIMSIVSETIRFAVLSLPANGKLLQSDGTPITSVPAMILGSNLEYQPDGAGASSFQFSAYNTAALSTARTVFLNVVTVGTCESNAGVCDDGRPPQP